MADSSSTAIDRKTLRTAALGGFAGTVVEWFDFGIYGFVAPILSRNFFDAENQVSGLLQTFAVFALAFVLRPIGGAFFGMLGDRFGRKTILITTVLLMSGSTAAVGILPTYAQVGIWSTVLLTLVRCLQGFSAGGEYAGAITYVIEHSSPTERGRWGAWMPSATFFSSALAAALVYVTSFIAGNAVMEAWGWRIPFLCALPLGVAAFLVREHLGESPMYAQMRAEQAASAKPRLWTIVREQWKPMVLLAGAIGLCGLSFYMFSTFMTTYLEEFVDMNPTTVMAVNVIALLACTVLTPFVGRISDRIGRRAVVTLAAALLLVLSIPGYLVASMGTFGSALAGELMIGMGTTVIESVIPVLLVECFPTRVRYTASAVTYNITYAIFGGTASFVSTWLIGVTNINFSPAIYLSVFAIIAFLLTCLLPETAGRTLGHGEDERPITKAFSRRSAMRATPLPQVG